MAVEEAADGNSSGRKLGRRPAACAAMWAAAASLNQSLCSQSTRVTTLMWQHGQPRASPAAQLPQQHNSPGPAPRNYATHAGTAAPHLGSEQNSCPAALQHVKSDSDSAWIAVNHSTTTPPSRLHCGTARPHGARADTLERGSTAHTSLVCAPHQAHLRSEPESESYSDSVSVGVSDGLTDSVTDLPSPPDTFSASHIS